MSLALSIVRHRFAGFAGTFVAIALGIAVVTGCVTLYVSSRPEVPDRYAAADVLVRSPEAGRTDAGYGVYGAWTGERARRLADRLAAVPGVTAAVPDHAFYVQRIVDGRPAGDPEAARRAGHPFAAAVLGGYRLTAGAAPDTDDEVALEGVPPGSRVEVLTAAGPRTWTVTGTLDGPGLYVSDAAAARLAAGVRVIGLTVTGDPAVVAAAAAAVTGADGTVLTGAARDALEDEYVSRIRWIGGQLLIAMVGLGGFVAIFVVSSTTALSAAQRRREIGLLRAVGATPAQVRRLMYAEALVVSLGASLLGVLLGALAAPVLAAPMTELGLQPPGFTAGPQPAVLAGSVLLGILVALAGTWSSARRSSRIPPLDALREAAVERRPMTVLRWAAGLLGVAAGVTLLLAVPALPLLMQTTAALAAAMALLVGAALLAPVLIVPLVRLTTWPWRSSATGMLVREGALTAVRRVASTAAPVLLTVGFTVLLTGMVATIERAAGSASAAEVPAVTVAAPDGAPGLSDAAVAAQRGSSELASSVLARLADGSTASLRVAGVRATPGLVLAPDTAADLGAATGSTVAVRFPDGTTAELPVTAVSDRAPADVVLPRDLVRAHDPGALTPAVMIEGAAAPAPGVRFVTAREWAQREIDEEAELIDFFLAVLVGLAVGYTGLAVANTLLMATAARRTEFRTLRLAGTGTGRVLRIVAVEALLSVAAGTVLGAAVAATALTGMARAVAAELGQPVGVVVPWASSALVVTSCAVVAVAAAAAPVLRRR